MASRVHKALIPCAGHGTRMRPFSDLVPKELVPLGSVPALRFIIDEARLAGIEQIGIVQRPGKHLIERFVDQLLAQPAYAELHFEWIEQPEPLGLAEAIAAASDFLGRDSYALLLPDNWLASADYRLADLLSAHAETGLDVLGALRLEHRHDGLYGNSGRIEYEARDDDTVLIRRLADKGPGRLEIGPGETLLRTCGRYVCSPLLLETIDRVRPEIRGEFSEVPAYQRIIDERGAIGYVLPPPVFDLGHPSGYLAASAYLHGEQRHRP